MAKAPSRATRFSDTISKIEDAKSEMEELKDELQSWLDNLPENLQNSNKADMLSEAIDNLDNIITLLTVWKKQLKPM
jgi:response regulator of citrate/malate metabolism